MLKLTFFGATRTVTGSMHLVEFQGQRFLLECGLYQGRRRQARERNAHFPFDPHAIQAVLISHAHLDHSGNLPTLVKQGFQGKIYASRASVALAGLMLPDSAHVQEKDVEFIEKRRHRRRRIGQDPGEAPVEPLYNQQDVERTLSLFEPVAYRAPFVLQDGLTVELYDAGHLLGSAALVFEARTNGRSVRFAFSGDVGRPNVPILRDPEPLPPVDYLVLEATYGDRLHKRDEVVAEKLARVVTRTAARGGRIVVPAFAVGRTQHLVYLLHQLVDQQRIPPVPIYVDSPLAVNITEVYRQHTECYDEETARYLFEAEDPFGFSRLRYITDVAESKALNELHGPFIVISASGMCEAGRILHHLRHSLGDPRNTILITGFQAAETLGRKLVEGWQEVKIFGEPVRVRAEIVTMNELSAHADQAELLRWVRPMVATLKAVYLVHGEPAACEALAERLREAYGLDVHIPEFGQSIEFL